MDNGPKCFNTPTQQALGENTFVVFSFLLHNVSFGAL